MSSFPQYSPLRQLDLELFLGAVPFDWVVEYVDGEGTLAPAWAAERAHPYPHPRSLFALLRDLDARDGGRRIAVAAAAIFVSEATRRHLRGIGKPIRAARQVVTADADDDAIAAFRAAYDGVPVPAAEDRLRRIATGIVFFREFRRDRDAFNAWADAAIYDLVRSPDQTTRDRVLNATLDAVAPPSIQEVLALLEPSKR